MTSQFRVDAYTDYRGGWKSEFVDTAADALDAYSRLKVRWGRSVEVIAMEPGSYRTVRISELRRMAAAHARP